MKDTINMVINPKILKNLEEDIMQHMVEAHTQIEKCDLMDAVLDKLEEEYDLEMNLNDMRLDVMQTRKDAAHKLSITLIPAPVKKRKKRKYTRKTASVGLTPVDATERVINVTKKRATKKKAVKKNATKK